MRYLGEASGFCLGERMVTASFLFERNYFAENEPIEKYTHGQEHEEHHKVGGKEGDVLWIRNVEHELDTYLDEQESHQIINHGHVFFAEYLGYIDAE